MGQATKETNNPGLNPGEGTPSTEKTEKPWTPAGGPDEQPGNGPTDADLESIEEGQDFEDNDDEDGEIDI
ncbi:MAG: hypothetical protein ACKVRN_14875 [Pyrinomonadaceae bacterium]